MSIETGIRARIPNSSFQFYHTRKFIPGGSTHRSRHSALRWASLIAATIMSLQHLDIFLRDHLGSISATAPAGAIDDDGDHAAARVASTRSSSSASADAPHLLRPFHHLLNVHFSTSRIQANFEHRLHAGVAIACFRSADPGGFRSAAAQPCVPTHRRRSGDRIRGAA